MNLRSMSFDKLVGLRNRVDAIMRSKIAGERRTLKSELVKLGRFQGSSSRSKPADGRSGRVAPKYRNPEKPGETWAGRGLKPRWLAAAIKTGKKLDDFLIAGAAKPTRKVRRKTRKSRK